jgi:hypothetical protein
VGRNGDIAKNEGLLRDVNDRIEEVSQRFSEGDRHPAAAEAAFLCECGREGCTESLRMTIGEYENVRSVKALFVVSPGHEDASVEDVVERHECYTVVRKRPRAASPI